MSQNGHEADALMQQIKAQATAEQMVRAMLDQTLQAPVVAKRASTNKVTIVEECHSSGSDLVPATKVLMIALPNGERWDVPLGPDAARTLIRQLGGTVPVA